MRSPLRNQILLPIAGLLMVTVILFTIVSSWIAADARRRQTQEHMDAIAQALGHATYPLTPDVVNRMGAMIGGEVIVVDRAARVSAMTPAATEFPQARVAELLRPHGPSTPQSFTWNGQVYRVTRIERTRGPQAGTLLILLPQEPFFVLWRQSLPAPLGVAAVVLMLAVAVAAFVSGHVSRRIERVRELFERLASGDFRAVAVSGRHDEIRDLMISANVLSERLRTMQRELIAAERLQLLGQLSGGLAHQLKNSLAGARLAVQLHERTCSADDTMLKTALNQLNLTEEQVQAVVSLRPNAELSTEVQAANLSQMAVEVADLIQPLARHWNIELDVRAPPETMCDLHSLRSMRGALLNLIQNAVEAAGTDGQVCVEVRQEPQHVRLAVYDSGPGFDQDSSAMTEAFRTTKPNGIGLGLTIAQHAVEQEHGTLTALRQDNRTCMEIRLPQQKPGTRLENEADAGDDGL